MLGADIVILSTPVRTIVEMLDEIGPRLWPGALVMDMGSTKAEICAALDRLPPGVQAVGGHPMCGKETAGFESAECGLYRNAPWVLSPLPAPQGVPLGDRFHWLQVNGALSGGLRVVAQQSDADWLADRR